MKSLTIGIGSAILILIALLAIQLVLESWQGNRYVEILQPPTSITEQEKILQMKLNYYEKSTDELKTLASLILGLSTLFGLALGVSSYINLKDTKKQYEAEVKRMRETIDREVLTLHRDFPLFRDMHHSILDMRFDLQKFIPESDYGRNDFDKIDPTERMMVKYYERAVAAFEFFDLAPFKVEAASIYTMLGSYYSHKYSHEKSKFQKRKKDGSAESQNRMPEGPEFEDVARARLYLDRARDILPDSFVPLNEIGFLEVIVTKNPEHAFAALRKSLELNKNQQRAGYYLSIAEHVSGLKALPGNPSRAIRHFRESTLLLEHAFRQENWQSAPPPPHYTRAMRYNCACGYARLALLEEEVGIQNELFTTAMDHFKQAFPLHKDDDERREALKGDLEAGGDLAELAKMDRFSGEIEEIKRQALGLGTTGPAGQPDN